MVWAFPQLDALIAFTVALGVCLLVAYFARAFFGTLSGAVGWIPYLGKVLSRSLLDVEHKITSVMGRAAVALESKIGASWHATARLIDHIGREIEAHAHLIGQLALLLPFAGQVDAVYRLVRFLQRRARAFERELVGIGHDVLGRVRAVERGIGADVLPRIRGLEREIDHAVTHDVGALRARTKALEREYERLYKWMRSHPWTAVTGAFVGAVAIALARLGLDWIRCPTAKAVFKKRGCNLWRDLDRLLGLVGEVALVTNICQVIPWLEEGFSVVAAPLVSTLTGIGAGLCGANSAPPELLPVTTLYVPSGPDATLYLP